MDVYQKLATILNVKKSYCDTYLKVSKIDSNNTIHIQYGAMYETPEVQFKDLKDLSELFGTDKVVLNPYSSSGCESCDYGSDYGHDIFITDPTKNIITESKTIYTTK